jgi:spermidine synthase
MASVVSARSVRIWRRVVLGLCFLSGISGLLYEVAWARMLHLLFGDTVLAVSTVLASFMAGLVLGSFWIGRVIDRRPRALGVYAGLEVALGLSALLFPLALGALTPVYVWLHQQLSSSFPLFSLVRFLLAFALLCIPTALMGATLPVLSRFMVQSHATLGRNVGALYAINTAGAVLGCFAAGYVLIGHVGLSRTVWIGAALNFAVALVAWVAHRWIAPPAEPASSAVVPIAPPVEPAASGTPEVRGAARIYDDRTVRRVLWAFAITGCAALSYEVIWTRALTFFIGNSTYAFSAMLTTFLCGLALGSVLIARLTDRSANLLVILGALQVAIGIYGVLTIAVLGRLFYGLDAWWDGFSNASWGSPVWLTFVKTFVVIVPPTLCMGATFPLVSRIVAHGPQVIGRSVGTAYAANTLGAIAGAWLSGFVAIPLLGVHGSLVATAAVSVGVGAALLASAGIPRRRQALVHAGALACLVAVPLVTPALRFADIAGEPEKQVLHYEEGVAGIVKVGVDAYDRRLLSINGWSVAGTASPNPDVALVNDYPEVQKMLAHLPMLLHPSPRRVLVIGFGAGGTAWSLSRYPVLEQLDIVEFVPGVIRAARFFPEVNRGVLADPRVRVTIDDGRNYLLVTPHTYDVLSVDTLDPKHAGNGNLYTREFYELSLRVLKPGGLFVQWLPYHQVDNASLKTIARTFQHAYPHATVWLNRFKGYTLLVGAREPLRIDVGRLEAHFRVPAIQQDLAEVHVATPWQFLESFAMTPDTVRRYVAGSQRLNTYDQPSVEFFGFAWRDPVEENLAELAYFADDVTPLLAFGEGYSTMQEQAIRDRVGVQRRISRHILRGYLAHWRRQLQEGTREYRKALKLDPRDEGVKFALGIGAPHRLHALAALERHRDDVKSLAKLGYIAWSEGNYDEAVRRFRQVLQHDPRHASSYIHLGVSYAALERFDASIAAYEEAKHLRADLAPVVAQSVDLVERLRRAKEHPRDPAAHARLGELYASDGRFDRAIECYERVTALSPESAPAFFALARAYEAEGRDAEAMRAYERGLVLDPSAASPRNNVEKLSIKRALEAGTPVTVTLGTGEPLRIDPARGASHYQLGLRYLRNDEAEAAVAALRQAVALAPDHGDAHLFLGLAHTSRGAHAEGEAAYRRAIALRPTNPRAYNYLGLGYHHQQRYRDALSAYRQAIAQEPTYAVAYVNLGASHEALGERDRALAAYRQALQHDANLKALQARIDALARAGGR